MTNEADPNAAMVDDACLMKDARILVVDDDAPLRELLLQLVEEAGYEAQGAESTRAMREALAQGVFDLVLLDLMLPGETGLAALGAEGESLPPVIMMSAFGTVEERVHALEMGAEDFVQKPCAPAELVARIRRVLRRREEMRGSGESPMQSPRRIDYGFSGWVFDATSRTLFDPEGVVIDLSSREFELLLVLVRNPQVILTREDLLNMSQGIDAEVFDRTIDVQVSRLRKKLSGRSGSLELIRTHRGVGYEFAQEVTRI